MAWITVDVDIDEFLNNCSDSDIDYILKFLADENKVEEVVKNRNKENTCDFEWDDSVSKLLNNRHQLSKEEEELIIKICNKIVV